MHPTDTTEIVRTVQKLKTKCTEGFDGLSTKILQVTIHEIAIPLEHIIDKSFVTGIVPANLKVAKIIPVFKPGNNKMLNNYRPISILPAFSKIMQKIVSIRLVMFFKIQYFI